MKRCPECRRDYYDDTLLYCLDDGNALLEGPASEREPATVILRERPDLVADPSSIEKSNEPTQLSNNIRASTGDGANSIAVLPFANVSNDAENEYFCDGLAEEILNAFTKIENLKVAARTSAFSFKNRNVEVSEIGKVLHVATILEGSVRKSGNRLRVSVQLINVADGYHIWADRYDREMKDIFDIQDEITLSVVEALRVKLVPTAKSVVLKRGTENPEAYQLYLKGRFLWNRRDADDLIKAREQFEASAANDPNYALAYVGLADTYGLLQEYAGVGGNESLPQARKYARRALAIDDQLGEAHATLGMINTVSWRWQDAERDFKRAIELNPNYATAYLWYGNMLRDTGQIDGAFIHTSRAQELDPLSGIIDINVGVLHLLKGNSDAAVEHFKKAIQLHANWWGGHFHLGMGYLKMGKNEEAIVHLEKGVDLSGRTKRALGLLGCAYGLAGKNEEANSMLQELKDKFEKQESTCLNIAEVYLGMGDIDQTFAWLEKDFRTRGSDLPRIAWYPQFDSVRQDSRFVDLLDRIRLSGSVE